MVVQHFSMKRCRRDVPREERLYEIIAGDGTFMPPHYSGRRRNFDEAIAMRDRLNKNGEYPPYNIWRVEPGELLIDAS